MMDRNPKHHQEKKNSINRNVYSTANMIFINTTINLHNQYATPYYI